MLLESFSDLRTYVGTEFDVPESFFAQDEWNNSTCIFLVSCLRDDRVLYIQDSIELLTGYATEDFTKGAMDFWFPLIHPDDLPTVMDKIIQSHQELLKPGFDRKNLAPLVLEYRFKRQDGEWGKIRDTKYLLVAEGELVVDKILCKFELLSSKEEEVSNVEDMFRKKKSCTKMLEFALLQKNAQTKQPLNETTGHTKINSNGVASSLTKREKEILLLIGEGLSTKMIADKCNISINTVETHRRHLLEKLQAKNSMELIKQASKIFWL